MEQVHITLKTELEQFQEQAPRLYALAYDKGYADAHNYAPDEDPNSHLDNDYEQEDYYENPYAEREDDSPRFYIDGTPDEILLKAHQLDSEGYKCGNRNLSQMIDDYKRTGLAIAWNTVHKIYAVDNSIYTLYECYGHLVDATCLNEDNDIPF